MRHLETNRVMIFSGNQYWFGLRKPPCQFLFGVCPCLQLFGNISYSLYSASDSNSGNQARISVVLALL